MAWGKSFVGKKVARVLGFFFFSLEVIVLTDGRYWRWKKKDPRWQKGRKKNVWDLSFFRISQKKTLKKCLLPLNFFGGLTTSPASGMTTHRSSTRLKTTRGHPSFWPYSPICARARDNSVTKSGPYETKKLHLQNADSDDTPLEKDLLL